MLDHIQSVQLASYDTVVMQQYTVAYYGQITLLAKDGLVEISLVITIAQQFLGTTRVNRIGSQTILAACNLSEGQHHLHLSS